MSGNLTRKNTCKKSLSFTITHKCQIKWNKTPKCMVSRKFLGLHLMIKIVWILLTHFLFIQVVYMTDTLSLDLLSLAKDGNVLMTTIGNVEWKCQNIQTSHPLPYRSSSNYHSSQMGYYLLQQGGVISFSDPESYLVSQKISCFCPIIHPIHSFAFQSIHGPRHGHWTNKTLPASKLPHSIVEYIHTLYKAFIQLCPMIGLKT